MRISLPDCCMSFEKTVLSIRSTVSRTGSKPKLWPDYATPSTAVQRTFSNRISFTMITYEKLFDLLEKKNIKPFWLVKRGLITAGTLRRLRGNKNVTVYTLDLISTYFNCSIFSIFDYTKKNP